MEGAEKGEKEAPLLQIDPKCFQDALRAFFQPIKTGDPRLDFYTMYKREATEYDTDYVKKYDEDLNTTLIFAGLFSAVSSAFVIDVHSNLQPDPNEQSAAILRAILLTLNQSAIPGETPTVPPVQQPPQSETVTVTCLMYSSLIISMLAAFVAMLGKQWLNRYLRNSGGSMIERCGDRQRKCDGLKKWPLNFFVESLPVMLQAALLLLACGLCLHMWTINTPVGCTLISLTGFGVVFYIGIVIAGMSSYACPFQTPASIALRGSWKGVRGGMAVMWSRRIRRRIVSSIIRSKRVLSRIHGVWNRRVRPLPRHQSLPAIPLEDVESVPIPDNPSRSQSPSALGNVPQPGPWLKPGEFDIICGTNTSDARCVSWILRHITDPEALDTALPLAGEIRWFDGGINVDLPYDLIVSTFEACFDSTRTLYPGSRDRAYYYGRAIVWIQTLARCKSEEFAMTLLSPAQKYTTPVPDPDLEHLLHAICGVWNPGYYIEWLLEIDPGHTHPHSQWISNLLLHHTWASRTRLNYRNLLDYFSRTPKTKPTIPLPLNTTLNRLLVWCAFLGSPVEEEALMVQDKSDRMGPITTQLSKAVLSAINGTPVHLGLIPHMLDDLTKLEIRPLCLTETAYTWCSVVYENRQSLGDWERLLLVCLEIGFRHLKFTRFTEATLTHTKHHRGLVDAVFRSQEGEVIADLLRAWTTFGTPYELDGELLNSCAGHLVCLHNLVPFSPRLERLVIYSVELIGYEGFEGVGVERFVELLNHLHVTAEDMDDELRWAKLLFDTVRSFEGAQHLSHLYWELLVELVVSESQWMTPDLTHSLQIITSLTEAKEWSKLECWMGILWMLGSGGMTEEDLEHSMVLLFRQRPGAFQKLEQWMERWSQINSGDIPEPFKRTCEQAHEAAQRDAPLIPSGGAGTEELAHSTSAPSSPTSKDNKFLESLPYHAL